MALTVATFYVFLNALVMMIIIGKKYNRPMWQGFLIFISWFAGAMLAAALYYPDAPGTSVIMATRYGSGFVFAVAVASAMKFSMANTFVLLFASEIISFALAFGIGLVIPSPV